MAHETWITFFFCLSSCLSLATSKPFNFSLDTQALENSGINPSHVMNSKIVSIHKFKRLYSRNSAKFLRIKNGKVDGAGDKRDPNVKITLESVGSLGQLILKSYDGGYYICLDDYGIVVAKPSNKARTDEKCVFRQEKSSNGYTTFRSTFNAEWYLGVKRDGQIKSARKTHSGQRAVHFLDMN